jgi:photosystem II stability/assembly factor-like uncharacterized protein
MKKYRFLALLVLLLAPFGAQSLVGRSGQAVPAPASGAITSTGPFESLHFRSIGPAGMSGRISDLAVYEANPAIFYVGTAHGGLWKTTDAGTTFEPLFQDYGLMSVGDVTISQSNADLVWLGSGESNNRQSTSWGDGVYKSTDGGKTFTNMGLKTSKHINRIVIDPRNNDTVFVAATGSLFGPGGERGIYKTTDGGRTWKQVLKVDDDTGANDLVMDSASNQILYATTYQRRRTACCMNGGGPGNGLWKSADGGETWTRLKGNGWPDGPLGRIAVDVYRKRPNILYALVEGPTPPGGRGGREGGAGGREGGGGREGAGGEETQPQQGPGRSNLVATVNANTATGLYRSDDGGANWRKVNDENPRPMYFSQVRIDPNDPDVVISGGVGLHFSSDGGKTIHVDIAASTHDDVHAIWINPANSNHVLIGNDGGLAVSHDQAKHWVFFPNLPVGLFYHVSVDNATPYNICGGMQDNYSWCGPSQVRGTAGIANYEWKTVQGGDGFVAIQDPTDYRIAYSESQDGNIVRIDRVTGETMPIRPVANTGEPPYRWNWDTPLAISPHDPRVIFAVGNRVFRSGNRGLTWEALGGDLTSNANRDEIVTMGVKGSDINIARNDGIQAWPTVVSFAESPKRSGVMYAGADDGNLQVSREGGRAWTNIIDRVPGIPKGIWVSEVQPSRFDEGTVYATFDGHRQNDFETYVYASNDFGQSWRSIAGNLKGEVVKTITEDPKNADVLYLGAETGLFVSLDRGRSWTRIKANLPTVRIDEITIHSRENAMVLATHGRAIWILDHLEPIQEYTAVQSAAAAKLFSMPPQAMFRRPARDRNYEFWGDQTFYGENPPPAAVISWFNKNEVGDVKLKMTDAAGRDVREISGEVLANRNKPGIQSACWDLRVQPVAPLPPPPGRGRSSTPASTPTPAPFGAGCVSPGGGGAGGGGGGPFAGGATPSGPLVLSGVYNVALVIDGKTVDSRPLRITDDPEVVLTSIERRRQYDMAMEIHGLQPRAQDAATAHASLTRQLNELTTTMAGRADVPADVKTSVDAFKKDLEVLAPRLTVPQGGRGGGGGGGGRGAANESLLTKIGQAKNGLMGGMVVGEQTTRAYNEVKSQLPKAVSDLNAAITKAQALSSTLATFNLTLNVPPPVQAPATAAGVRRTSSQ